MQTLRVNLPNREYDIKIEKGIFDRAGELVAEIHKPCRVAVVTDSNVGPLYGERLLNSLEKSGFEPFVITIPAGEGSKSVEQLTTLYSEMLRFGLTRSDLIVALGGGVVGDITGFCASTLLRGIPFIQIPTTLLAQVDSSVGGKVAVNLPQGKNLVGAFYQPKLVLCDTDTLNTLPDDTFRDGCAEVIKYGILYDARLFAHLQEKGLAFDREAVITRCVELKRDVVAEDEFDTGSRMKLNLGHTIGHGVEAGSHYTVSHGKAVAIGMAIVSRAAEKEGICDECTKNSIVEILKQFGLPTDTEFSAKLLYSAALSDKKRTGGTVNLIVPETIGRCVIRPTPVETLKTFIQEGL